MNTVPEVAGERRDRGVLGSAAVRSDDGINGTAHRVGGSGTFGVAKPPLESIEVPARAGWTLKLSDALPIRADQANPSERVQRSA